MGNTIVKRITYEEEIYEQLEANLAEMEAIQKAVLSLEDRNEQECLRCRYIDVIEDEEGNRKRLTWRDVALRVYRKDDENAVRATTRLHNAVINSLKPNLDEDKLIIFMSLLEKYTVSHIKILEFFNNPKRHDGVDEFRYMMGSPTQALFDVYPDLNTPLFKKMYDDLYIDGMVSTENLNTTMTGSGMVQKRTTDLGDDFLRFVVDKGNL